MKTPIIAAAAFLACFGHCGTSQAQAVSVNFTDYFHDYELYLAEPETTAWYIVWTLDDGSIVEQGPYMTEESAQDRVLWFFIGGREYSQDVQVLELPKPPTWVYFDTFDTYAEASQMAS